MLLPLGGAVLQILPLDLNRHNRTRHPATPYHNISAINPPLLHRTDTEHMLVEVVSAHFVVLAR